MRARSIFALSAIAATTLVVVVPATPAAAAYTTSVAGTVLTINVTGQQELPFRCNGGSLTIGAVTPSPTISCATVTQVTVNGDSGEQTVYGRDLDQPAFAANPKIVASLGGGNDTVSETDQADSINTGAGGDSVFLHAGGATNTSVNAGDNGDSVYINGTAGHDVITATSSTASLAISMQSDLGVTNQTVANAEIAYFLAYEGNDSINTVGIVDASDISSVQLYGGAGNDELKAGTNPTGFYGDTGANSMTGGIDNDTFYSWSNADTIVTGGGFDQVIDEKSLRSGGRTITSSTSMAWTHRSGPGDTVTRVRDLPVGAQATVSLTRPGQQVIPQQVNGPSIYKASGASPYARNLYDIHVLDGDRTVNVAGDGAKDDLLDVTVPTGAWTINGNTSGEASITTANAALGNIGVSDMGPVSVHGPWTNKNQGFAHRVHRDLLFRFASSTARDAIRDQLTAGTTTRSQVVQQLMGTDEYRGLDVDRVYLKFLRRNADPSGRASWITSLRNGKSLLLFRGQLIGSDEYFTKAGGTNATYVDRAYADILGRLPDPSGRAYWLGKLNAGADRGAVAISFMNAAEPRRFLVEDQFLRFLDRVPTANEYATWDPILKSSKTGEQQLVAFLAASGAYYDRS